MFLLRKQFLWAFLALLLLFGAGFAHRKRKVLHLWYCIKSDKPAWAEEQMANDFAPFSEISQEALDKTYEKIVSHQIFAYRYRIIDGAIYRMGQEHGSNRAHTFDVILKRLQKSRNLPNVDFLICMMDGVPEVYVPSDFWITGSSESQAPLLAWAKKKSAPYVVLVPDPLTTVENCWQNEIALINRMLGSLPWEKRVGRAFWRGTASDKGYTLENYTQKPRFLISEISKRVPESVDAGFCKANEKEFSELFQQLGLLKGHAPIGDHLAYKYLPVLDGWMCSYPGFQWRLLSGSLTLKQESDEVQYFYSALKPYVHYLPIRNDMSDLVEKIEWAKEHDSESKQIAEQARQFGEENLMPDRIYAYLYWVLEKYASLQSFDGITLPMKDPAWRRVDL